MIAIVAQNHTLLTLFRMLMTEHGFEVSTFLENDAAILGLEAACPELMIVTYFSGFIDESLPFVIRLHESSILAQTPLLFCASHEVWPDDLRKTSALPWLTLVDQPFRNDQLAHAISAALP